MAKTCHENVHNTYSICYVCLEVTTTRRKTLLPLMFRLKCKKSISNDVCYESGNILYKPGLSNVRRNWRNAVVKHKKKCNYYSIVGKNKFYLHKEKFERYNMPSTELHNRMKKKNVRMKSQAQLTTKMAIKIKTSIQVLIYLMWNHCS